MELSKLPDFIKRINRKIWVVIHNRNFMDTANIEPYELLRATIRRDKENRGRLVMVFDKGFYEPIILNISSRRYFDNETGAKNTIKSCVIKDIDDIMISRTKLIQCGKSFVNYNYDDGKQK